jgi:hypothetical protein
MDLFLRKVIHPQAHENYRVLLKEDGVEVELGSIGVSLPDAAGLSRLAEQVLKLNRPGRPRLGCR